MSVQTLDQRLTELLRLHESIEAEIRRVKAARDAEPRKRRSRHDVPPCGTEQGYQHHRARGERADDACREAHAENWRHRELLRRIA